MRRIAFINEKGGTCKTTLAVNIGAWLATHLAGRVLLVDLDTQGHCGKTLGVDVRQAPRTVMELLVDPATTVEDVAVRTPVEGLWLVPSNKALADFPIAVAAHEDRSQKLLKKVEGLEGFDYVLFDSPPSMGLITTNIFLATREIVIPVALTYLSLDGCAEIMESVGRVREQHGHEDLAVTMVVPTLYRKTLLADEILVKLGAHFPDSLCRTALGYNVKIDEAQSHGQTIFEYAPWSRGAEMLDAIASELHERGQKSSRVRATPAARAG